MFEFVIKFFEKRMIKKFGFEKIGIFYNSK